MWSLWLCVLLPGNEQYLKPPGTADAFLFRSLLSRANSVGATVESSPAKREQEGEEIKETAQNDSGFYRHLDDFKKQAVGAASAAPLGN